MDARIGTANARGQIWVGEALTAFRELRADAAALTAIAAYLGLRDAGTASPAGVTSEVETRRSPALERGASPSKPSARLDRTPAPERPTGAAGASHRLPSVVRAETTTLDTRLPPPWLAEQAPLAPLASGAVHAAPSLIPVRQRRAFLTTLTGTWVEEGAPDIARIINRLARGRPLDRLPRGWRRTLREGVEIRRDAAPWLEPFHADQTDLIDALRRLLPPQRLRLVTVDGGPEPAEDADPQSGQAGPRAPVLVLSDLGTAWHSMARRPAGIAAWRRYAQDRRREGRYVIALVPAMNAALPETAPMTVLPWDERSSATDLRGAIGGPDARAVRQAARTRMRPLADAASVAERLALRVSAAQQVSPWLLRTARRSLDLPPAAEAALWFSPLVHSRGQEGLTLTPTAVERLRGALAGSAATPFDRDGRARDGFDRERERDAALALARADRPEPGRADGRSIEERLIELEILQRLTEATAEASLRPALKTISDAAVDPADRSAEHTALWAAHAWDRASPALRRTAAARQLAFAAAARLDTSGWLRSADGRRPALPPGAGWLFDSAKGVADERHARSVQLRTFGDGSTNLVIGPVEPRTSALHVIHIPGTEPLWLQARATPLQSDAPAWEETLTLEDDGFVQCDAGALADGGSLTLRAIDGRTWRVERPVGIERALQGSLLDVRDARAGTRRAIVVDERLALLPMIRAAEAETHSLSQLAQAPSVEPFPLGGELDFRLTGTQESVRARVLTTLKVRGLDLIVLERLGTVAGWRPFDNDVRLWPPVAGDDSRGQRLPLFADRSSGVSEVLVLAAPAGDREWQLVRTGDPDREDSAIPLPPLWRDIQGRIRSINRTEHPRFLILAPPEHGDVAHRLWDMLVTRLGGGRVVFDHDGRAFGDALADPENSAALADIDAVVLLADDDPSPWLPRAVIRAINEERLALLSVPLSARWAAARGRWSRSLHKAAMREPFFGQPATGAAAWLAEGREEAFELVAELLDVWQPRDRRSDAESTSPEPTVAPSAAPTLSFGTSLRARFAAVVEKRTDEEIGIFRVVFEPEGCTLERAEWPSDPSPALLFVHGEASDTLPTFAGLVNENSPERRRLAEAYGARIFAWRWRSVTVGPLRNAALLATAIGSGAPAHVLTHSAGGLLPELLAFADAVHRAGQWDAQVSAASARFLASPGAEPGWTAALTDLFQAVASRPPYIDRFVRVACPASGTEVLSHGLDRWLNLLRLVPFLGIWKDLMPGMSGLFSDPEASPGLTTLSPGAGVLPLLASAERTSMPLTVVAGVAAGGGLTDRILTSSFSWAIGKTARGHDLMVPLASAFGGLEREHGVSYLIDRGARVTHFNYLRNERTRRAVVDAVLTPTGVPPGFEYATSLSELQERFAHGPA